MDHLDIQELGLAVTIEPHGWLLTLPMVIGLIWIYLQPAAHPLKELWRSSVEREAMGWCRLGVETGQGSIRDTRASMTLFWSIVAALSAVTLLSLASYVGMI